MPDKKNPTNTNQAIELYIQRVTELSQLGQKIPSNEELLKIASELGISDEEIRTAQKQSQAHFIRAQGYVQLSRWDDAITELEDALAFNPFNLPMLHLLINSYLGRWKKHHQKQDEEQIKFRVKQCLEIQPDDKESLNLLAKLDQSVNNYNYQIWGISALALVIIGSGLGFFFLKNSPFSLFGKNDQELQLLKDELNNEILELKDEQLVLYNQLLEKTKTQEQVINNTQLQIETLKNEINKLSIKNEQLTNKLNSLNNQNKVTDNNNPPSNKPENNQKP